VEQRSLISFVLVKRMVMLRSERHVPQALQPQSKREKVHKARRYQDEEKRRSEMRT
jgi:hypothetical protein